MRSLALPLLLSIASLAVGGCAAGSPEDVGSDEANVDTTGCSGVERSGEQGPVAVSATVPHSRSCWNIPTSGLRLSYSWLQRNDATPSRTAVGFWAALHDASAFVKSEPARCEEVFGGSMAHDTSGQRVFRCTASKNLSFEKHPNLLDAAYDGNDRRGPWKVQVAVALDDAGQWDSLDGANYRFEL